MAFNSAGYWAFFAVVMALSAVLRPHPRTRVWFLTAASLYFYYASNGYLTLLIIFGTFFDFVAAKKIEESISQAVKKRWLIASITSNLLILGTFKYLSLFLTTGAQVLNAVGVHAHAPAINLLLPVGISFYTFEAISYVADVYRCRFHARRNWREFNYFIVFFPKLTAGPIIRPQNFFDNISNEKPLAEADFEAYLQMIFFGLFQKVVLADTFSTMADKVYGSTAALDSLTTLIGIYAFSLQIYFDFVGYTNIAIGSAGLLGVSLPDNFRRPYIATCLSDFWKRWHISLSSWLRDYLFIPLGGSRGSLAFICRNLMITMTLGGLWHGASWNFAIWGALNGGLLCLERLLNVETRVNAWLADRGMTWRLGWSLLTFQLFSLLWIPFRARTFDDFTRVVRNLLSFSAPREITVYESVICTMALLTIAFCVLDEGVDLQGKATRLHPVVKAPVFAALVIVSIAFSNEGNRPFIYFRF